MKNIFPTVAVVTGVALTYVVGAKPAEALTFDFNYSFYGANTISASGTLTTEDTANANGGYEITGITGTRTSHGIEQTITGLVSPFDYSDNDNLLFPKGYPLLTDKPLLDISKSASKTFMFVVGAKSALCADYELISANFTFLYINWFISAHLLSYLILIKYIPISESAAGRSSRLLLTPLLSHKPAKDSKLSNLSESSLKASKYSAIAIWQYIHASLYLEEL